MTPASAVAANARIAMLATIAATTSFATAPATAFRRRII